MKRDSKISELFQALITAVIIIAVVKIFWSIILLKLPVEGVDAQPVSEGGRLYYRYKLATDLKRGNSKPKKRLPTIQDMQLLAIYDDKDNTIAVIQKRAKSIVLVKGDKIDGFKLIGVTANSAEFERDGKRYTLKLKDTKIYSNRYQELKSINISKPQVNSSKDNENLGPIKIKRENIDRYIKNMDKIWKDISISELKKDGKLSGFKVRYVRRGSFFQKIGLRRGDLIVEINGEEIKDYSLPMRKFKEMDTLDGMTITVIRNGERKELEYEID